MFKFNRDFFSGAAVGFAAGFVAKSLHTSENPVIRDFVKASVKAGIAGFEFLREGVAEFTETVSDLAAEVKSESSKSEWSEVADAEVKPTSDAANPETSAFSDGAKS